MEYLINILLKSPDFDTKIHYSSENENALELLNFKVGFLNYKPIKIGLIHVSKDIQNIKEN